MFLLCPKSEYLENDPVYYLPWKCGPQARIAILTRTLFNQLIFSHKQCNHFQIPAKHVYPNLSEVPEEHVYPKSGWGIALTPSEIEDSQLWLNTWKSCTVDRTNEVISCVASLRSARTHTVILVNHNLRKVKAETHKGIETFSSVLCFEIFKANLQILSTIYGHLNLNSKWLLFYKTDLS